MDIVSAKKRDKDFQLNHMQLYAIMHAAVRYFVCSCVVICRA